MDIFISYRRKDGDMMAHLIEARLKDRGVKAFLDKKAIHNEDFAEKIYKQIALCPNFLMIVTEDYFVKRDSSEKDWVFEEIELAKKLNKNIIGICFDEKIMEKVKYSEDMVGFRDFNIFLYSLIYETSSIDTIIKSMRDHDDSSFSLEKKTFENDWYSSHDMTDDDWLWIKADQEICKHYDGKVLRNILNEKIFESKDEINVCIYQCRDIKMYAEKYFEAFKDIDKKINYYGFCYDVQKQEADEIFGKDHFVSEVEAHNRGRTEILVEMMKKNQINGFDLIDFTLYLKDLKEPQKRLEESVDLLNEDGAAVFIRELDDSLVVAYPDKNHDFSRLLNYLDMDEGAGNRTLGRRLLSMLRKAGADEVRVSEEGVSTESFKQVKQKGKIFDAYLSFLRPELRALAQEYPEIDEYRIASDTFNREYEDIRDRFKSKEFYFRTGYITAYGLFNE